MFGSRVRAQAGRFGRLFVATFLGTLLAVGTGHLTAAAIVAAAVGALEVTWRAMFPTTPAADSIAAPPAPPAPEVPRA